MIKSYLLKPRFSSFDLSKCNYFTSTKTLIDKSETETWFINQFNKQYKLTIKRIVDGEAVYDEKIIDEKLANQMISKSKNNSVRKNIYSVELPNISQKTRMEYYLGELRGLVIMSIHFKDKKEAENFKIPSYAVRDITNDSYYDFINLSKLTFEDIEKKEDFQRFYKPVQTQISKN